MLFHQGVFLSVFVFGQLRRLNLVLRQIQTYWVCDLLALVALHTLHHDLLGLLLFRHGAFVGHCQLSAF
jgi:hypothetical protein